MADDVTPVEIERQILWIRNALGSAQLALAKARDHEVELKHQAERAARLAMFSPKCPKVGRTESTVAERDAWIDQESAPQREAYEVAEAARKAAQDHIQTLRDQAMLTMALSKSVTTAYGLSGYGGA